MPHEPLYACPGWAIIRHTLVLALGVAGCFFVTYGGANWITSLHTWRVPIHTSAELQIPFLLEMTFGYVALYPMFALAPFVLRTRSELSTLARSIATTMALAAIGFLLVPAQGAFPPQPAPTDPGWLFHVYSAVKVAALPYNMAPSLHVALAWLCAWAYSAHAGRLGKCLFWSWAGVVSASTVFTHQHHLLDVVTGLLLALVVKRFVYDPGLQVDSLSASACAGQRHSG